MIGLIISGILAKAAIDNRTSGVGKIKTYAAINRAQDYGIEFGKRPDELTSQEELHLKSVGKYFGIKQPSSSTTSYPTYVYRKLNSAYKAISGINYPYQEFVVKNDRGDIILIHRDYDKERDLIEAGKELPGEHECNNYRDGYIATVYYLATGGRFHWKSSQYQNGVEAEIFGKKSPDERKLRMQALTNSKHPDGYYPVSFAEYLVSDNGDELDVRDGVFDAIRDFYSPAAAKEYILDNYYKQFQYEEMPEEELPF